MDSANLDQLVEAIASRVRARLVDRGTTANERPGHCAECTDCQLPLDACASCGLNPLSVFSPIFEPPQVMPSAGEMARYIDHTHLKPQAGRDEIEALCREAREHNFFSVCVNSGNVNLASRSLAGTQVKVCAVVGFPLGAGTTGSKAYETREAIRCGASEIDMVINVGALRSREHAVVLEDIRRVVKAAPGKVVKVIFETGMLSTEEKAMACALSKAAGAHFVKTSTGFGPGGATVEDVSLMRCLVGSNMGVKASGGVRSYDDAVAMLRAGASRLGCSSGVAIVTGGQGKGGY